MLDAVRGELGSRNAEVERLASTFKVDEKGRFDIAADQFKDYQRAVKQAAEAKSAFDTMTQAQELAEFGAAPAYGSVAAG